VKEKGSNCCDGNQTAGNYSTRSITGTVKLSNARDRSSRHIAPSVRTNLVEKCWQDVRRFWAYLRRERCIRKAAVQLAQFDDRLLIWVSTGVGSSAPSDMAEITMTSSI
jgi:hypothetical protein